MGYTVDEYCEKIMKYSKKHKNYLQQKMYTNRIKENLGILINKKLDHLLTESFLDYIAKEGCASISLYQLIKDDYSCVNMLNKYYRDICVTMNNTLDFDYPTYIKNLDKDTKKAANTVSKMIAGMHHNFYKMKYSIQEIERILFIILSYCHVNNRMQDFKELLDHAMYNIEEVIESIELNTLDDFGEWCTNDNIKNLKVFTYLNSKCSNKRVIY